MPKGIRKYRSAFAAGHVTPESILAFHRRIFGDARMEDPPSPPAGPPADPPVDGGFPANTPIAEMTVDQREAYWKHQSRKHETTAKARGDYDTIKAELDALKASTQTDAEKVIDQARKEAGEAATAAARAQFAGQLVTAELKLALAGKVPADKVAGVVAFLDHSKFLTATGEVDADKVQQYAAGLTPAGGRWPDMGGGNRGDGTAPSKAEAGRAEAQKRWGDKKSPAA